MVRPLDGAGAGRLIAATACLLAEPRSASAQDPAADERALVASWLPLYTDRRLARLENENRLPQLCTDVDPAEVHEGVLRGSEGLLPPVGKGPSWLPRMTHLPRRGG